MTEYRLTIERPGLHSPTVYFRTTDRAEAMRWRDVDVEKYRTWEPDTRITMEYRDVTQWCPYA